MINIKIDNTEYQSYSGFEVEESLGYPFHIRLSLVPGEKQPLDQSFLHLGAVITYAPKEGDKDRFTWMSPLTSYYGYVAGEQRVYDLNNSLGLLILDIYHPLHLLDRACRFRIFHEKKLTEIIEEIFVPYQSEWSNFKTNSCKFSSGLAEFQISYCTQYQETDLHFFLRLCETYGVRMTLIGQTIQLDGLETFGSLKADTLDIPPIARIQMTQFAKTSSRSLRHRNIECTEMTEDLATETVEVTGTTTKLGGEYPYWVDTYDPNPNSAKAKLDVQTFGLQYRESVIEISNRQLLNNAPLVGIRAGQMLNLGTGTLALYVQKVKCNMGGPTSPGSQGGKSQQQSYDINISAVEKSYPYAMPARHKKPQIFCFLRALVIEPKQPSAGDDTGLGRIKVKFLWQEQESPTCWVRLTMPYAGKTHGFYVMPEIGDEVLIGFEGGDIDRPFCLGSVYNKDAKVLPSLSTAEQMEVIHMRTPQNIFLKFHEVPGGPQTAILGVKDQVVLTFDSTVPSGSIASKGKININSDSDYSHDTKTKITINCGGCTISLDQSGTLSITNSSTGKFSSQGDQTVSTSAAQTIQGQSQVIGASGDQKLKSANQTITADSQTMSISGAQKITAGELEISAGGVSLSAKGGTLKISAANISMDGGGSIFALQSGMAKLNAGVVKINC